MYPERRPYATAVNHAGYLSKPLLPPVEALRILNSTIGIDVPRSLRRESTSITKSTESTNKITRPTTAGKPTQSRGVLLFKPPLLDSASTFVFKEKDYHNSQQVALNAQLSCAVEELFKTWLRKLSDLLHYLNGYPSQCVASNKQLVDAMENYLKGYFATDVLPMTMEQLVQDFNLKTTPEVLSAILSSPALDPDRLRRTLDNLLNAKHFLAPVEQYVQELEPLALVALRDESFQQQQQQEGEEKDGSGGVTCGPVWLSKAAVALHEKFHYNPSEYALRELRKSDQPIERLERRVLETKDQKEHAIDAELPGEALNFLTAQVDLSNDLLLMNKARMELVRLHSKDVQELKPRIDAIIQDARQSVQLLKGRIDRDFPPVKKDLESLQQDTQNTNEHIKKLKQMDEEARKEACKAYRKFESDENELWALLLQTLQKLINVSNEKDNFVKKEMRLREQRARDLALAAELLKAQEYYYDRLRSCEESLLRWSSTAEMYATYVEAFVPKLLKKVHDAEEADTNLYNHEAQEYVRRHEMFEYAVEEGRATRQVHVDRLKTSQRSKEFDVERAEATLDPHVEKYKREMQEAQVQLEEARAYIDLLENLERERRNEVEPIIQHVISHNRTLLLQNAGIQDMTKVPQLRDVSSPVVVEEGGGEEGGALDTIDTRKTIAASALGTKDELRRTATELPTFSSAGQQSGALRLRTGTDSSMMATVAHPHVQARSIGINHEEMFFEKYRRFADDEQRAVEDAAMKLRQSRNNLDELGSKYDNVDYVNMLLGTSKQNYISNGGVGNVVNTF